MVHETYNDKKASTRRRQRANERWKRRRSYTRTQWTGYRRSSIHASDDDDDDDGRTGIAMPVVVGCCGGGSSAAIFHSVRPSAAAAVRIEQFLTDVRRRVYGSVSAVCFERGEEEGQRARSEPGARGERE